MSDAFRREGRTRASEVRADGPMTIAISEGGWKLARRRMADKTDSPLRHTLIRQGPVIPVGTARRWR